MIDTIIFDIGNVLAGFCWKDYLLDLGICEDARNQIADKIFRGDIWSEFDCGKKSDEEIVAQCILLIPDYEKEIRIIFETIEKVAFEYDYAKSWIEELKIKGFKIYLLSNYGKRAFEQKNYTFLELVDGKVISYEVNAVKPQPQIFKVLLSKYDIVPQNSVFIDDMEENIIAARTHGINGIQFFCKEQAEKELATLINEKATSL